MTLSADVHGAGEPTLVLLHGMAGTRRVWDGVVGQLGETWTGTIVVPDLPGHGRSPHVPMYSFDAMADDVGGALGPVDDAIVVGHSLGGVVALALGSGAFGCRVAAAIALSVKVTWSSDELARAAELALKPAATFATEAEARERYLRVSGLASLVDPSSPIAAAGVVACDGGFRLAHDPATSGIGAPDMAGLLAAARASVVLACGSDDAMVSHSELLDLDSSALLLDGLGHNVHVEGPDRVADLILHVTR